MDLVRTSEELLLRVKTGKSSKELEERLAQADLDLVGDDQKKAFWINSYNAFYQLIRSEGRTSKERVYKDRLVRVAGAVFSLDEIEHGILRRYRWKPSFGYLPDPFTRRLIKGIAVEKIDWRIHFALNCGAKSCPPIAFYSEDKINEQLDLATRSFLEQETEVLEAEKEIRVSRLLLWYRGDFGGLKGVREILKDVLGLNTQGYKIIFKPYSWEDQLANFVG